MERIRQRISVLAFLFLSTQRSRPTGIIRNELKLPHSQTNQLNIFLYAYT